MSEHSFTYKNRHTWHLQPSLMRAEKAAALLAYSNVLRKHFFKGCIQDYNVCKAAEEYEHWKLDIHTWSNDNKNIVEPSGTFILKYKW